VRSDTESQGIADENVLDFDKSSKQPARRRQWNRHSPFSDIRRPESKRLGRLGGLCCAGFWQIKQDL